MKDISRNLTMLFDYYEVTMAHGYFRKGMGDMISYFDVFYRSNPDNGGSDDDSNNGGLEIDMGGSLGDDLFNGDNIDPDGWTKID